jgi:predicted DNA-binding transcriptional regulator AlpA/DNA-directed RNA polymerase subunit RPC12/RpoP
MRVEGVYTYLCEECELLFAVVARFSVKSDLLQEARCPKCSRKAAIVGEGHIEHQNYEVVQESLIVTETVEERSDYPELLDVSHVAAVLGISRRVAYEIMETKDFPLIRIRKSKRVSRNEFFEWLNNKKRLDKGGR